jgi:beta-glucuronidase
MKSLWIRLLILCLTWSPAVLSAQRTVDLGGSAWTFQAVTDARSTPVSVPSTWMTLPGYEKYVGTALYQHDFTTPELKQGQVVRLHFDAVYDVAQVWLNGCRLGVHEGGYTPFEFDVTKLLRPGANHLLVEVDNSPTLSTIPGLATAGGSDTNSRPYGAPTNVDLVGWMPYGGITRPVSLIITDDVYLQRMKIDARPDLKAHTAEIEVRAWIHNGGSETRVAAPSGDVAGLAIKFPTRKIAPNQEAEFVWKGTLRSAHLWSLRDPFLYPARVAVADDALTAKIGVREIRVSANQLLLNGVPVHAFGANRVNDDPKEGIANSDDIVERDMSDMLAGNMRMMRIAHYPETQALLNFADQHGMLIIAEAGNWNFSAWQMADPLIRALWQKQMKEMIEQDWNHPSVIAWSVGNEYESSTTQGIEWTRDMRAYTLNLDGTRLITFASRFTGDPAVKTGKDEASQYSDFVSVNFYGKYAKALDHVHELYPDKPIFVTEFGKTGESGEHDPERTREITTAVTAIKARPWVIGGSLWSWNDYRSLRRGTSPNGVRFWGVVDVNRKHRDSWSVVQKLFATELP